MLAKLCKPRGIALIVELLIVLVPLLLLYFSWLDTWHLQAEIQQGYHIHNYYMNRIRVEGWLSEQDMMDMYNLYNDIGLEVTAISAPVENGGLVGVNMSECTVGRVLRDTSIDSSEDLNNSSIWLFVEASPIHYELGDAIRFTGRSLSEKVSE